METSTGYLEGFIENNYKTESSFDAPLTEIELKQIALEMGCTEEGWLKKLDNANNLLLTAREFYKGRNYYAADRAISEAILINPSKAEYFLESCKILMKISGKLKNENSLQSALQKVDQSLILSPNYKEAIQLKSKIMMRLRSTNEFSETSTNTIKTIFIVSSILVALYLVIF
tara:strand:- start:328 stop:846 length:519 start_codon:yes stop_codon:yes gene_type:complete